MKKVCVVTGTRAEYGLLRWVIKGVQESAVLALQLVVTGSHLSSEFGLTVRDIETDGIPISRRLEMLLSSDTAVGITKSMGLGVLGFADLLADLQPDLLLVLGDRYEIFTAVIAAMIASIPVAHLHGGERTEGAYDESIRHAITKMSQVHFVAAENYRRRVIQLGEQPDRVFLVGGLGIDSILNLRLLDRGELEEALDFKLGRRCFLVTFHPATLEPGSAERQMGELLGALESLSAVHVIFTAPNADNDGRRLTRMVEDFVERHPHRARLFMSLGQLRYLSAVKEVDAVVGNSSSGLTEVPSLGTATINIGDRQRGRLRAASVIDCAATSKDILRAVARLDAPDFQRERESAVNPYGSGGASTKIVHIIEDLPLQDLQKKSFFDLSPSVSESPHSPVGMGARAPADDDVRTVT